MKEKKSVYTIAAEEMWSRPEYREKQKNHPWKKGLLFQNPFNKKSTQTPPRSID